MLEKLKSSKVKCCFTVNGKDWSLFKQLCAEERISPSTKVGQFIYRYLKEKEGEENA